MTTATHKSASAPDYVSSGKAACMTQRSPREVATAAKAIGVHPVFTLNGVTYYSGDAVEKLLAHFREGK